MAPAVVHVTFSLTWMPRSHSNIEIEDRYVREIMERYRLDTVTEAVDFALRHLAGEPMTLEEALAMRGANAILEVPADGR
jgi:Arc/MetJ family transcription regulator